MGEEKAQVPFGEMIALWQKMMWEGFEMIFTSNEGLEKQGLVIGTIMKEQLHLIMYAGTRAHYYAKHKEHVERMIQSISLRGK